MYSVTQESREQITITWRSLLSVYAIIPILTLIMVSDFYFFKGFVRNTIPSDPDDWVAFRLFFVLPHIFVGNFLMLDKGYIDHYKAGRYVLVILFSLFLYPLMKFTIGSIYFWMLFDIWTIWHGCAQQIGLNRMLVRQKRNLYKVWTGAYFFVLLVVFSQIYVNVELFKLDGLSRIFLVVLSLVLFGVSFMFSSKDIRWSLPMSLANGSLPAFSCLALSLNYPLFAIISFRVIHDITALYIYWVHDLNRNSDTHNNWVHRVFEFLPIPSSFRIIFVSFALAAFVSIYEDDYWAVQYIAISFSLFHYVVETFVWRRESIHRQYVPFA